MARQVIGRVNSYNKKTGLTTFRFQIGLYISKATDTDETTAKNKRQKSDLSVSYVKSATTLGISKADRFKIDNNFYEINSIDDVSSATLIYADLIKV